LPPQTASRFASALNSAP